MNASGNLDKLEGGLDALMQATVCNVRGLGHGWIR